MYAIVQCGGHQVKMVAGRDASSSIGSSGEAGAEVTFDQVLLVERDGGELVAGAPFVAGARVVAVVDGEARGPKIRVFKKKRRKGMRRTKGHARSPQRVSDSRRARVQGAVTSRRTGSSWHTKKDRAARATGATATRSGSA